MRHIMNLDVIGSPTLSLFSFNIFFIVSDQSNALCTILHWNCVGWASLAVALYAIRNPQEFSGNIWKISNERYGYEVPVTTGCGYRCRICTKLAALSIARTLQRKSTLHCKNSAKKPACSRAYAGNRWQKQWALWKAAVRQLSTCIARRTKEVRLEASRNPYLASH